MNVLEEAQKIVWGDREQVYDDPNANFRRIAGIWSQILGQPITMQQVALCMIGVKLARLSHSPQHRDSIVDTAGYAACLERINNAETPTQSS